MRRKVLRRLAWLVLVLGSAGACAISSVAAEIAPQGSVVLPGILKSQARQYYWKTTPVGDTAQLVTLFCRSCGNTLLNEASAAVKADADVNEADVPLVSVLRDTLGDNDPDNDRLLYVWLLSYVHPNAIQYLLSAMPFVYWRVGDGGSGNSSRDVSPLLNLATPERSLISGIGRQILQSSLLDPSATAIRATSRAYRGNESDYQRLRLEEAASYLRRAPIPIDGGGLSQKELDTVIGRLELRKRLLGGLVTGNDTARVGAEEQYTQERIRSRNWEVLRQCAEHTGLIFEPLKLAGDTARYGIIWFPADAAPPSTGTSLKPLWKILSIRNPWKDRSLRNWNGPAYTRDFDENGSLLPFGTRGFHQAQLIPLAVYSLDYPTAPLLVVDFRNGLHIRRHEMTQRAINDITAGIIGISHFSNWYYYAAADLYDFVVSRHGTAMNQSARLDCYSQFRAALALDRSLNPELRDQMRRSMNSLAFNPLEGTPAKALQLARTHYQRLLLESQDGRLSNRIDKERRGELAAFGESKRAHLAKIVLHDATFGAYTSRAKKEDDNLARLDRERQVLHQLNFLDALVDAGTAPEITYTSDRIQASISGLSDLMPEIQSSRIRAHAVRTLKQLGNLSQDADLQANCATALRSLEEGTQEPAVVADKHRTRPSTGIAAFVSTARSEDIR